MGIGPGIGAAEHPLPLCRQATTIQCVKYGYTYTGKYFAGTRGKDMLKCSLISIYFNLKLIVLHKILHLLSM